LNSHRSTRWVIAPFRVLPLDSPQANCQGLRLIHFGLSEHSNVVSGFIVWLNWWR